MGGSLTGMTIAPAGWGSYGGYLVVGRSDGAVVAVNTNNATYKTLGTTSGVVSDVEFGGQVLYLAAYNQSKVLSLSPGGSFTTTASLTCNVDGLAVEPGVRVFAACGSNDEIYSSPLPAGTPKLVGKATLSGGWAPAGIIWDGKDTLIAMAESPYQLVALSP